MDKQDFTCETVSILEIENLDDILYASEEYECAMMFLDSMKIPTHNGDGETLSLVGRIMFFKYNCIPLS